MTNDLIVMAAIVLACVGAAVMIYLASRDGGSGEVR